MQEVYETYTNEEENVSVEVSQNHRGGSEFADQVYVAIEGTDAEGNQDVFEFYFPVPVYRSFLKTLLRADEQLTLPDPNPEA